jgi:DNA-binding beta-propeller fold protein YncE
MPSLTDPSSSQKKGRELGPICLVSGRWDNTVAVVDIAAACDPNNDGTPAAIVSRIRVTPDIPDGSGGTIPAGGQPVSIAVSPDGQLAYVVNHSGQADPQAAAAFQHGHPGLITIVSVPDALDPRHDRTLGAVRTFIPTETAGPVGCAITPGRRELLVASAEAPGCEDGGNRITMIDLPSGRVLRQIPQSVRRRSDGTQPPPSRKAGPNPEFGHYPCTNGIAVAPIGAGYLFTANGGTNDVTVIDLTAAREGRPAEVVHIPVETGSFGIAVSPDASLVAVASRECARTGKEGSTISLIDIAAAISASLDAERARIRVGSDRPEESTRPFAVAFTSDGAQVIATCFRSNTVSFVNVADALAGRPAEHVRLHLTTPNGGPACPRGVALTPDGRHAVITGGAKTGPGSSLVWILDVEAMTVIGTVTEVGNESYFLAVVPNA